LGDLGIEPIFFDAVGYNPLTGDYDTAGGEGVLPISGTEIREALKSRTHGGLDHARHRTGRAAR